MMATWINSGWPFLDQIAIRVCGDISAVTVTRLDQLVAFILRTKATRLIITIDAKTTASLGSPIILLRVAATSPDRKTNPK
jgi:hypothetical protein